MGEADSVVGRGHTRLFVEDRAVWESQLNADRRFDGDPGLERVPGGVVLPLRSGPDGRLTGGVLRPDGTYVSSSRHLQHARNLAHPANVVAGYVPDQEPVRRPGTALFAGGGGMPGAFGHFLVEDLARLWPYFGGGCPGDSVIVFANPNHSLDAAGFALLRLAGITDEQIVILTEPTAFDEVVVPDQSQFLHPGSVHLTESKRIFDTIRDSVNPGTTDKVYLTYRKINRDQLAVSVNEEMIEDLYRRHGFTVVAPETLDMADQISLIAGAREIACTAGTLSHLVAFAQDGVTLDIFVRNKTYLPEIQWGLDRMRSAQVNIVDTLRPVIPSPPRRGVIYFTSTPQWAEFARVRFGSDEPAEPPPEFVASFLTAWAQLLGRSRKWALDVMPEWRASDLVESVHAALLPDVELSDESRARLEHRFYAPERRIDSVQTSLSRAREDLAAEQRSSADRDRRIRTLEQRLESSEQRLESSEQQLERSERRRVQAERRRERAEQRLAGMRTSLSWRVTRPLRRVSRLLRRRRRVSSR